MGSICGIVSKDRIDSENLITMITVSKHRYNTPEAHEMFVDSELNIGFAVGIMDVVASQVVQPYSHGDKVLISDSNIYNIRELQERLGTGENASEAEVLLACYEKWGYDFPNYLNGDFAIVIYDYRKHELYCARDRFGTKPFNYCIQGDTFLFSSELKQIMGYPTFKKRINTDCLAQYLSRGYIHSPETIFEGTYKLEPGHYITYANGDLAKKQYYNFEEHYFEGQKSLCNDYEQTKIELECLLKDAIAKRICSNTPIATFLSGGIDSTLMTALIQYQQTDKLKTFTIGFKDASFDESKFAAETAKHLGVDYNELQIDENDMLEIIDQIPHFYDEPYGDSSQIPTMAACNLVSKSGLRQVITGDGSDEQFCGYGTYVSEKTAKKLDVFGAMVYHTAKPLGVLRLLPGKVQRISMNRNPNEKTQFFSALEKQCIVENLCIHPAHTANFPIEKRFPISNWMMRAMLVDVQTYVPGTIIKVERASAGAGVSTRSPFCDHRVTELVYRFPFEYLYKGGVKKRILKDILYQYVPKEMMERPKKGFSIPEDKWLKTVLKDRLTDFCAESTIKEQNLFDYEVLHTDLKRYLGNEKTDFGSSGFYWRMLMLQMWYDKYMK